jgi:hypothetical protein
MSENILLRKIHGLRMSLRYSVTQYRYGNESRILRWAVYRARMDDRRNTHRNFCGETSCETPNWKTEKKWQDNIKWNFERQAVKMEGEQNWFKIIFSNNLALPIELSGSATSHWVI